MTPKSMPSGYDPMGAKRFSDQVMRQIKRMTKDTLLTREA